MSWFWVVITAIAEILLFPFAWNERRKAQAHEKRMNRYAGQRNRWTSNSK